MSLSAALFLLALPPAANERSELVAASHLHQWEFIERRSDGGFVSFDTAYRETTEADGKFYPVALIRYFKVGKKGQWALGEVLSAFDCNLGAHANIRFLLRTSEEPETSHDYGAMEAGAFERFDFPEPGRTRLMQHVCGSTQEKKGTN